jgi:hypothetical protein
MDALPRYREISTGENYASSWKRFEKWCAKEDVGVSPWECSAHLISLFLMELLETANTPSLVHNVSAAIVFVRNAVLGDELGLQKEIHMMREINRRSFGERAVKRANVISLGLQQKMVNAFSGQVPLTVFQDLCVILMGIDTYGRYSDVCQRVCIGKDEHGNGGVSFSPLLMECKFVKRKNDTYGKFEPLIIERREAPVCSVGHIEST